MRKAKLIVTKEGKTGKNIEFQDTRNNQKMSYRELISRLETGKSSYNVDYCVKHNKNGNNNFSYFAVWVFRKKQRENYRKNKSDTNCIRPIV